MLTLRYSQHVHRQQTLKGFRSCLFSTGWGMKHAEQQRLSRERLALIVRSMHRLWLDLCWRRHRQRVRLQKTLHL